MPLNPFAAVDAVLEAHEQVSTSQSSRAVASRAVAAPGATLPTPDVKFKAPPSQPAADAARSEPAPNGAPHPALLLIRQGIAAQDKAAVRGAMAAAAAAGVQIEPSMRAMLLQWLGDTPLPLTTPAATAAAPTAISSGLSDNAAQVVPGAAVGHASVGMPVPAAEPTPVESPHPALLLIREGIASKNREGVRAAVASAQAAQVVIEPKLYNMIMQWLSEGASQAESREMVPPAAALAPVIPTEASAEHAVAVADAATASHPSMAGLPCAGVPGMAKAFAPGSLGAGTGMPTATLPAPTYPPKAPWHMAGQPTAKVAAPVMSFGTTAKGSAPPPVSHANGIAAVPLVGVNRDLAGLAGEAAKRRLELEAKQKRAREASKPAAAKSVDTAGLPPDAARALLELLSDPGRPVAGPGVISAAPVRNDAVAPSAPEVGNSTGLPGASSGGDDKAIAEPPAKLLKRDASASEEAPPPPSDGPPAVAAPPPPPEATRDGKGESSPSDSSDEEEKGKEAAPPAPKNSPPPPVAAKAVPSEGGQDATKSNPSSKEMESWQYLKGNTWGAGNFFDFNSF